MGVPIVAVLRVHFFHTTNVAGMAAKAAQKQVDGANAFFRSQMPGITIDRYPRESTQQLPWNKLVRFDSTDGLEDRLTIRRQCHEIASSNPEARVPVIFCQFGTGPRGQVGQGEAVGTVLGTKTDWLPFILIDASSANPDGLTLLHEMGHCVGLKHPEDDSRLKDEGGDYDALNVMGYGKIEVEADSNGNPVNVRRERCKVRPWQLVAYRTAYFYGA